MDIQSTIQQAEIKRIIQVEERINKQEENQNFKYATQRAKGCSEIKKQSIKSPYLLVENNKLVRRNAIAEELANFSKEPARSLRSDQKTKEIDSTGQKAKKKIA